MRRALPYRPRYFRDHRDRRPSRAGRTTPRVAPPVAAPAAGRARGEAPGWLWAVVIGVLLAGLLGRTLGAQDTTLAVATVDSAWSRVSATYYDTTFRGRDWRGAREVARGEARLARDRAGVRQAVERMLAQLGESHFAVIPAEAVERWAGADVPADSLGDVGIELRALEGAAVVSRVAPGSPAEARGVRPGWRLEQVGDMAVAPFLAARVANLSGAARALAQLHALLAVQGRLEGRVGSRVRLGLRDGRGRPVQLAIARRAVRAEVVRFGHLPPQQVRFEAERFADDRGCIGVMRFNTWMLPVMSRLDDAMVAFRHCRGVIVDLRGNLGGVAAMVMGMGGYFVDSSTSLGTMHTRGGALRYVTSPRRSDRHGQPLAPFAGPLAILVDGHSVSTSEIFAAGLQVLGRARVFGEVTAGQALPSMLATLPNGDVMQHVVADFTAPDGARIEARGVIPDELIPLRRSALLAGRDEPLLAAMAWVDRRAGVLPATASAVRSPAR